MRKIIVIAVILAVLLPGCSNIDAQTPGQPKVVTGIDATYTSGAISLHRQYTEGTKMRAILDYLRCLNPYGTADVDPEAVEGSHIQITVSFSDGTAKIYDQRADQYLRQDGGLWQNIQAEKGQELALLLGFMTSD